MPPNCNTANGRPSGGRTKDAEQRARQPSGARVLAAVAEQPARLSTRESVRLGSYCAAAAATVLFETSTRAVVLLVLLLLLAGSLAVLFGQS
ncbi:uncharacterized protein DMAD_01461 [Drosophila madeirensis]|uniref:Uncharacterized protein n=1 Tax=Drosophila madeirensis TaxID=30013 RepID=A0AAU9G2H8_DROMD